jgi:arylsulfatase
MTANFLLPEKALAQAPPVKKPNILVIMGDDIGMWNIGAYHRGMMAGRTPNLDKIATEGMLFTDYYAEASCTAGRANFITGQLPIRTGMTTVGQAGAPTGLPTEVHGLCHGSIRQEPSRRQERVPADRAWLR